MASQTLSDLQAEIKHIIENAPLQIDKTPDDPNGDAQSQWIEQGKYWDGQLATIDEDNLTWRDRAMIIAAQLFASHYPLAVSAFAKRREGK